MRFFRIPIFFLSFSVISVSSVVKNLSSLSVFFRAFRGDNASVSGDSTPLPQQKDTPRFIRKAEREINKLKSTIRS